MLFIIYSFIFSNHSTLVRVDCAGNKAGIRGVQMFRFSSTISFCIFGEIKPSTSGVLPQHSIKRYEISYCSHKLLSSGN